MKNEPYLELCKEHGAKTDQTVLMVDMSLFWVHKDILSHVVSTHKN